MGFLILILSDHPTVRIEIGWKRKGFMLKILLYTSSYTYCLRPFNASIFFFLLFF
jgi:hypothetical protein